MKQKIILEKILQKADNDIEDFKNKINLKDKELLEQKELNKKLVEEKESLKKITPN